MTTGPLSGTGGRDKMPAVSDSRPILRHTRTIAILTLISRVLGLLRESVFAAVFATGGTLSAFRVAFLLPNLSRRLFGEGALASSLVPILTETLEREGREAGQRLAGAVLVWLGRLLLIALLAIEALLLFLHWLHPDPVYGYAAVMMPYMPLICLTAMLGGVLQVGRRFWPSAASPVILNLLLIAATFAAAATPWGASARMWLVCVTVLLAGALQLALQWAGLRGLGLAPLQTRETSEGLLRVRRLMLPMVVGLSASQMNALIEYGLAYAVIRDSRGEAIGPAVLGYAQYLYQLPLGLLGISLATAIYPELSSRAAAGDREGLARLTEKGARYAMLMGLPAAFGLMLTATPLIRTLLERGRFSQADSLRVAGVLACYAPALPAHFLQHLLVRVFYAMKEPRVPMSISLICVAINSALGAALVFTPLQERGLALAFAVTGWLQAVLLIQAFHRRTRGLSHSSDPIPFMKIGVAGLAMAGMVLATGRLLEGRAAAWQTLAVMMVVGIGGFLILCRALRIRELSEVLGRSG